jgi:hypothetical protein
MTRDTHCIPFNLPPPPRHRRPRWLRLLVLVSAAFSRMFIGAVLYAYRAGSKNCDLPPLTPNETVGLSVLTAVAQMVVDSVLGYALLYATEALFDARFPTVKAESMRRAVADAELRLATLQYLRWRLTPAGVALARRHRAMGGAVSSLHTQTLSPAAQHDLYATPEEAGWVEPPAHVGDACGCLVRGFGRDPRSKPAYLEAAQELGRAKFTTFLAARAAAATRNAAAAPVVTLRPRRRSLIGAGTGLLTTDAATSGATAGAAVVAVAAADSTPEGEMGSCEDCIALAGTVLFTYLLCACCSRATGSGGGCCSRDGGGRRARRVALRRVASMTFADGAGAVNADGTARQPTCWEAFVSGVRATAGWLGTAAVITLPLAMLLGYTAFALWYVVIFGTFQPLHVTWAFMVVWLIAESTSALVTRPTTTFLLVYYQFAAEPYTAPLLAWLPFCRRLAPTAPLGGVQVTDDPLDAFPLSRSFDGVTMARGVAFASRMAPDAALSSQPAGLQLMARAFRVRWEDAQRSGLNRVPAGLADKPVPLPPSVAADRRYAAQRRRWMGALYALKLAEVGELGQRTGELPPAVAADVALDAAAVAVEV